MNKTTAHINAYILAGGKSARMGEDKGMLKLGQKRMINHVLDQVKRCADEVVIVANKSDYAQFGFRCIPDIYKGLGPIGGIYSALKDSGTHYNFVVGCDMPFLGYEIVNYLIDRAVNADVTIPTIGGKMQPLCGIYTQACVGLIEEKIKANQLKMMSFISASDHQLIAMESSGMDFVHQFENINTPEAYDQALKYTIKWK